MHLLVVDQVLPVVVHHLVHLARLHLLVFLKSQMLALLCRPTMGPVRRWFNASGHLILNLVVLGLAASYEVLLSLFLGSLHAGCIRLVWQTGVHMAILVENTLICLISMVRIVV